MTARGVPEYFGWARYGITPADVVCMTFGCEPERIRPLVVFAPMIWARHMPSSNTKLMSAVSTCRFVTYPAGSPRATTVPCR